ncbi:hypothetical protein HN604_00530 [archaeon]|jgi:5'(3')-deoxyribonucleotidase|nr:hypothetical protein [archaeon]MBT6606633.1 hypothetical protein [archaeon]MBT7251876.1 hypothetical protein [archaeon]MBT7660552.1 hypothetical protein [archaeon]
MRIGIDVDEVLAGLLPAIISYHNETHDTSLTREDFKTFNFWESWGGTQEESEQKVCDFFKSPHFKNIRPIEGSQDAVNILKEDHELFVITSRQDEIVQATIEWLNVHFPKTFSKIYFAGHYFSSNENSKTKKQICDFLKIELLIEDNINYALECKTSKRKILLLNQPWNQEQGLPKEIKRVHSWEEIIDSI